MYQRGGIVEKRKASNTLKGILGIYSVSSVVV